MRKIYRHTLIIITILFSVHLLPAQNQVTLTAGTGTWYPPIGCTSFYVQVWGGGAGGSSSYGGGGGSFSQSPVITVSASRALIGYSYVVGTGGGGGTDGTDSKFENCWAYRGLANGATKQKYVNATDIAASYFGGSGGMTYNGGAYYNYGGGGGSAYTTGDGNNGEPGTWNLQGNGGSGTGTGGYAPNASGGVPGGGGGGSNGSGARGEIRIFWNCNYSPGQIGNAHTVPSPPEIPTGADFVTNVESPTGFGYTYSWEQSTDNATWATVPGANQLTLAIPAITTSTYFRRVINGCNPNGNRTNAVLIKVFTQSTGKNGVISGKVTSKNGVTGVQGITITATKTVALKGSPQSYQYTATTNSDGVYSIAPIFYGDRDNGDPDNVSFTIVASKTGHRFSSRSNVTLSNISSTSSGNDFIDSTVYAISGRVTQYCAECLPGSMGPYGVGNVKISNSAPGSIPVYSDSLNEGTLGSYSTSVTDPGNYMFTPGYLNHQFSPSSQGVSVSADVSNINFSDTTTRLISGKLVDGAGKRIGSGSLLFEGVLKLPNNTTIATFKKRATINTNDSAYSLRLPAGIYKVSVEDFASAYGAADDRYILQDSLKNFFNSRAIEPLIDVSSKDSIRNLVYHRPPVIVVTGLNDTACNTNPNLNPGVVFRTNVPKAFRVNVFEGPPSLGQRIQVTSANNIADTLADYLRVYTSVTKRTATGNADTLFFRLANSAVAMLDTFLLPGAPNTIAPHTKPFSVQYIDRYGRMATPFAPKATVVGVFNPTSTFTTAFPEVPTLILHSPPGDQSYSFWSRDTSVETAISYSVANEDGLDGFVNVSVGPTVSMSDPAGAIGIDVDVIATASYTNQYSTNYAKGNEVIETSTSNITYQTTRSGVVNGTSGDVYIGTGKNYILGKSIYVDFIEGRPAGGCEIEVDEKLFVAPKEIRTEFAYSEDHILNVVIPQQQALADQATDPLERNKYLSQVSVWQQVIDNNKDNKKNAAFVRNRSFSNGVIIEESQSNSKSETKAITYEVNVGHEIAAELGLRIANVGASGGVGITIRETKSYDTTTNITKATTTGYHLQDGNPGDYYSVDIKKDPLYGTPVFDLLAGTSSCPPEDGAQNRDMPQILSGDMKLDNLLVDSARYFTITLANKSESGEARFYNLSVDGSTSEGLVISNSGSTNLVTNQVAYYLEYGESRDVQIKVEKFNHNDKILSYPAVEFYLTDNCGTLFVPNTVSTAKISFNYASPCGGIALASPLNGWVVNKANANTLPVTMGSYTLSGIDSITLEYEKQGTRIWKNGFSVKRAAIANPDNYTQNWDISGLADTVYDIRLKLVCQGGSIIYSDVMSGVIDRKAPLLVGKPQPASQFYNEGRDQISFTYNEPIDRANLNQGVVTMLRRPANTLVPVTVTELDGKLSITPSASLGNIPDSFMVVVNNISDIYGNVKVQPDTLLFKLDTTNQATYTGNNIATVFVTPSAITEGSPSGADIHFRLRERTNKITRVYFNISGTAIYNTDYTISYDTIGRKICSNANCTTYDTLPVYNEFLASPGYVNIDSGKTEVVIHVLASADFEFEGDETMRVNLAAGSTYKLQDSVQATVTILNLAAACPSGNIMYVNRNATGNKSGTSWQNAMTSLQNALKSPCSGITQIWVAKGVYKPTADTNRDSAFVLKNNLAIYGGFAGTETQLSQRNWYTNPTILSGDIGLAGNNADNSYNVIRNVDNGLNATAVLDGFIVTGGNANKSGDYIGERGAGSHNRNSAPSYYNCIFTGNNAAAYGGGVFNETAAPLIVNSVFAGNAALWGGGVYNESAATKIINSSFSGNQVINTGGGVYTYGTVAPQITNSILWGNSSTAIQNAGGATPIVTYSIVAGGYTGTGNLNADPLFILQPVPGLSSVADLRLQGCSPAINAGSNATLPAGITTDLSASARIVNTTIDMGAYERSLALSTTIYVDANANGNNSGESWANAYTNLSSALTELNNCTPGTTILIAAGTYTAPANTNYNFDKLNATILGGYPNGGGVQNASVHNTILKGNVQILKSLRLDGVRVQAP